MIPGKGDIRVLETFPVEGRHQVPSSLGSMNSRHTVSRISTHSAEFHSHIDEPIVDEFSGMVDVKSYPLRIGVLPPTHEIGIGQFGRVLNAQSFLHRRTYDVEHTACQHGMSTEDRPHVDNLNPRPLSPRLKSGSKSRDSRSHHHDIRIKVLNLGAGSPGGHTYRQEGKKEDRCRSGHRQPPQNILIFLPLRGGHSRCCCESAPTTP